MFYMHVCADPTPACSLCVTRTSTPILHHSVAGSNSCWCYTLFSPSIAASVLQDRSLPCTCASKYGHYLRHLRYRSGVITASFKMNCLSPRAPDYTNHRLLNILIIKLEAVAMPEPPPPVAQLHRTAHQHVSDSATLWEMNAKTLHRRVELL